METHAEAFRGRAFQVARGSLHPEFSDHLMDEERDLREKYWDVKEGDVVVDVGASYGSYTLSACAMGATVVAFEPEPSIYRDLVANLHLNGWYGTRAHVFDFGLWDGEAKIPMQTYAPHWPAHTISGPYDMTTLDLVASMNPDLLWKRLDWVKVDVEGAEEHVLRGGISTIRKFHPKMLVECHTFLDAGILPRVEELLRSIHPDYLFEEIPRPPCVMLVVR